MLCPTLRSFRVYVYICVWLCLYVKVCVSLCVLHANVSVSISDVIMHFTSDWTINWHMWVTNWPNIFVDQWSRLYQWHTSKGKCPIKTLSFFVCYKQIDCSKKVITHIYHIIKYSWHRVTCLCPVIFHLWRIGKGKQIRCDFDQYFQKGITGLLSSVIGTVGKRPAIPFVKIRFLINHNAQIYNITCSDRVHFERKLHCTLEPT